MPLVDLEDILLVLLDVPGAVAVLPLGLPMPPLLLLAELEEQAAGAAGRGRRAYAARAVPGGWAPPPPLVEALPAWPPPVADPPFEAVTQRHSS